MAIPPDAMHIGGVQDPESSLGLNNDDRKFQGVDGNQIHCIIRLSPMNWVTCPGTCQ